jgi:hypothetical protein
MDFVENVIALFLSKTTLYISQLSCVILKCIDLSSVLGKKGLNHILSILMSANLSTYFFSLSNHVKSTSMFLVTWKLQALCLGLRPEIMTSHCRKYLREFMLFLITFDLNCSCQASEMKSVFCTEQD